MYGFSALWPDRINNQIIVSAQVHHNGSICKCSLHNNLIKLSVMFERELYKWHGVADYAEASYPNRTTLKKKNEG